MAFQIKDRSSGWGWVAFGGVINIILGVMVYQQWPASGLWVIGMFISIELIIQGINAITLSRIEKDALKVIQFLPKITTTHNELTVKNNVPFSDRIHDNYITSKIRAKLMLSNHLPIRNMKIITSDNIVYIIGALSSESYKIVLKIIRKIHIDGKIISFINILDKAK
ncbi:MAG: hypothetical protein HAW67_04835 [Endozoicomonadaceae bacterium]|nr:hypothetical protein [Endozoicomonadaceae bacterium]